MFWTEIAAGTYSDLITWLIEFPSAVSRDVIGYL